MSEIGKVYPLAPAARPAGPPGAARPAGPPSAARPQLSPRTREDRTPGPRENRGPAHRVPEPLAPEPLWRESLGARLRALRTERGETLAQTAERAGISPQYLSEIERGRKEASSEMIAALAGALGVTVADLMTDTAADLRRTAAVIAVTSITSAPRSAAVRPAQRPSGPVALAA